MSPQALRRTLFAGSEQAVNANTLASALRPELARRTPSAGWTTRAVWYEDDRTLMAVVGGQERGHSDLALAHGLHLAAGRSLQLVLHERWAGPTLHRAPWLAADVSVATYSDEGHPTQMISLSQAQSRDQAGGPEKTPALHLGDLGTEAQSLIEWATNHPRLEPAHTRNVRVWGCNGQRVLTVSGKRKLRITAGIDAKSQPAGVWTTDTDLSAVERDVIRERVGHGIEQALTKAFGPFAEHHLQMRLRRQPDRLGLEHPLLREVPAWRPAGGGKKLGRGFLDLVGLDPFGDVVVVETKLAADDMLILQGLDYWIWATAPDNRDWLVQRLHADPKLTQVKLLYAIGAKGSTKPQLSKYARAQLKALDPEIPWRIALLEGWETDEPQVQLLPPRTPTPTDAGQPMDFSDYTGQQRSLAATWKITTPTLPEAARVDAPWINQTGLPVGRYPFCLPASFADHNLLPQVRPGAIALFTELDIPWHCGINGGPGNHLLSSQVQCTNALYPMVKDADRLQRAFGHAVDIDEVLEVEPGRLLTFEYIGPVDFFGEGNGQPRRRGIESPRVV